MSKRAAIGTIVAAAMLAGSASPAMARHGRGWGHPGYGYGYGYRHHHGGSVAGALIGGLLIGGVVVAVANAVERDRERRPVYAPVRVPEPRGDDYGDYDRSPVDDLERAPEARQGGYVYDDRAPVQGIASQGDAVDACSTAALDETRGGQVNDITRAVRWSKGWRVEGVVDRGAVGPDGYRDLGRFVCSVEGDQVAEFRFDEGQTAWAR